MKKTDELKQAKESIKKEIDRSEDVMIFASEYGIALVGTTLDICGATCSLLDRIREEFGETVFEAIIKTVQEHKGSELEEKADDLKKLNEAMDKLKDLMDKLKGE